MQPGTFNPPRSASSDDGIRLADYVGQDVVIRPDELATIDTSRGPGECIRAQLWTVEGTAKAPKLVEQGQVLIFWTVVKDQLSEQWGNGVPCRVTRPGRFYQLEQITDHDPDAVAKLVAEVF